MRPFQYLSGFGCENQIEICVGVPETFFLRVLQFTLTFQNFDCFIQKLQMCIRDRYKNIEKAVENDLIQCAFIMSVQI